MIQTLIQDIMQTSWLEAIAALTGILSIWFGKKESILVFPIGIISVLIYVYICFNARLYADTGINIVYFVMSVYGWYNWLKPHKEHKSDRLRITFQDNKHRMGSIIIALALFVILAFILTRYTDSDVPIIDAFTSSLCVLAMYLTTQKKVENWIYYLVADCISIPLYVYKGLVLTSIQYLVFFALAVAGLIAWRKEAANHV